MKSRSKRFILLALTVSLGMVFAGPANAQTRRSLEALRTPVPESELQKFSSDFTTLVRALSSMSGSHPEIQSLAAKVEQEFGNLPPDQLTILANAYDRPSLSQLVERVRPLVPEAGAGPPLAAVQRSPNEAGAPVATFAMNTSPTGLSYADYGGCVPGTSYHTVPNIPSDVSDDYTLLIEVQVANALAIPARDACESIVVIFGEGTNLPACIIAAVLDELANGVQATYQGVLFCDPVVLGAENHSTYENTFAIFGSLSNTQSAIVDGFGTVENQVSSVNSNLTNTGLVLSSNILQAQADLDTRVNKVDADVTTGATQVDSNIAALQALQLRMEIERNLALGTTVGIFETPKAQGGYLELVGTTVQTVINDLVAAGQNVGKAQQSLNAGNAQYAAGNYKAAYHAYVAAYQTAVQ